ncbi:MAG: ATP-binding protein [Bacteroidaceae bacterium]|nr:ATP-binding protein [Bacteroidaceae bacterium]
MTFTMMCGLPNSGKTTKASDLAAQTGATLIRLDNYTHLYLEGYKPRNILDLAIADISAALECGEDVIYDSVNATAYERGLVVEAVENKGCSIVCIYMNTPVEVCCERDNTVWAAAYAQRFEMPTETEGFEVIISNDGVSTE